MKRLSLLIFTVFFFCEKKVETIREIYYEKGPYIVESVLCTKIVDGKPYGVTTEFFKGDTVNLWINWRGMIDKHKINCYWVEPNGTDYAVDSLFTVPDSGNVVTIFSLVTTSLSPEGEWAVEIYLDDKFFKSLLFYLNP